MRRETSLVTADADAPSQAGRNPSDGAAVDLADAGPAGPAGSAVTAPIGGLTALLALGEPARTEALEKVTNSGRTVYLRSKTGNDVRWRYGEHILIVPPTPKPFAAAHAIHLLFCAPELVEEVEE